jgi:hypothetical protein
MPDKIAGQAENTGEMAGLFFIGKIAGVAQW